MPCCMSPENCHNFLTLMLSYHRRSHHGRCRLQLCAKCNFSCSRKLSARLNSNKLGTHVPHYFIPMDAMDSGFGGRARNEPPPSHTPSIEPHYAHEHNGRTPLALQTSVGPCLRRKQRTTLEHYIVEKIEHLTPQGLCLQRHGAVPLAGSLAPIIS